jgi:hypothetical protein
MIRKCAVSCRMRQGSTGKQNRHSWFKAISGSLDFLERSARLGSAVIGMDAGSDYLAGLLVLSMTDVV